VTPPHVIEAALKAFEELKEAAKLRATLLHEVESDIDIGDPSPCESAKSSRSTMYDAIAKKKLEATSAQKEFEKKRRNLEESTTPEVSAVRRLLKCEECATKEGGMCDTCRQVFLSKKWISVHPEWESRDKNDEKRTRSGGGSESNSKRSLWPSAKSVLSLSKQDERKMVEQLSAARDREQTLLEELDAYKRALRFARNFIELENHADTSKRKKLSVENAKLREAVKMYQTQLVNVTSENQRLASALQEIVTGRHAPTLSSLEHAARSPTPGSPADFYQNDGRPLVSPPAPTTQSRGFFTWTMGTTGS
jgi:hypothetical protein